MITLDISFTVYFILNRRKFENSGVTFVSVADLRRSPSSKDAKCMCTILETLMKFFD